MRKFMNLIIFALLSPILIANILVAQTRTESPKLTIVVSADKSEIPLDSEIEISITITNSSEEPLTLSFGHHGRMPDGYQFDLQDDQGKVVARFGPRYKQLSNGNMFRLPDRPAGSMRWGELKPGKSMVDHATISDDYKFDHPGKYTIQVSRKESWMSSPICSNIITITVLPKGSKSSSDEPTPAQQ